MASRFSGQSLPNTLSVFKYAEKKEVDDPWQEAYRTCLQYEARAKSRAMDYTRSRVLGYLIREAPYNKSRDVICQEINSCNEDHGELRDLAELYIRSFLRLFRSSRRSTPSTSQNSSRPSFDTMQDSLRNSEDLKPTPRTTSRERALERDNYRCVVTGAYAADMYAAAPSKGITLVGILQVAHILPGSINEGTATGEGKRDEAAEVWAVMRRLGRISPDELNGDQVHRLENVITLWDSVHSLFNGLLVWFEPSDDDPYKCFVRSSFPQETLPYLPEFFTLTTTDPDLPRPSPDYLRLHAACARVAYLFGAADYVRSQCGIVTVSCLLHKGTHGLVDTDLLEHLKKGAWLVNTGRGAICDKDVVAEAVKRGQLNGYLGDVWNVQPTPPDHVWRTVNSLGGDNGTAPHKPRDSIIVGRGEYEKTY